MPGEHRQRGTARSAEEVMGEETRPYWSRLQMSWLLQNQSLHCVRSLLFFPSFSFFLPQSSTVSNSDPAVQVSLSVPLPSLFRPFTCTSLNFTSGCKTQLSLLHKGLLLSSHLLSSHLLSSILSHPPTPLPRPSVCFSPTPLHLSCLGCLPWGAPETGC